MTMGIIKGIIVDTMKENTELENKILVAYASKYGSTQEVADAVAVRLREEGLVVDLQPMRKIHSLAGYRAVVLGAAIYYSFWHKDARDFLTKHASDLSQHPVAVFALGPNGTGEDEMRDSQAQLDKELAKFPWLKPVGMALFGGRFPARLRFPDSLVAALPASPMHGLPASDARDWTAISNWAGNLAQKFQPIISH